MRSFPISVFRDKKGRYVSRRGNPQVSLEWLERESPGRKSAGMRVGHRAARRRSHIARFCPRRLDFVKKALAMAFGVGSAKVTIAVGVGRAMAITLLGFNALNASVIGVYVATPFSAA